MPLNVLEASLDESADARTNKIFAVGAFLTSPSARKSIEEKWMDRLAQDDIAYFRATDCRSVRGPFQKLIKRFGSLERARGAALRVRQDLEAILIESHWVGFALGIIMPDYRRVLQSVTEARLFYSDDPTVAAYGQMFFEVALAVHKNAPQHLVAYIADASDHYEKLADTFEAVKQSTPALGRHMSTVAPLDDKTTTSLQVADLIASVTKDLLVTWVDQGVQATEATTLKWENHIERFGVWDEQHMHETIRDSIAGGTNLTRHAKDGISRHERRRRKKNNWR